MARRSDAGAAAVEFALVMPILFLIVFGIIDFGRAYFVTTSLSHAAREGARAAALGESPNDARAAVVQAAAGAGNVKAQVSDDAEDEIGAAVPEDYKCTPGEPVFVIAYRDDFQYLTPIRLLPSAVAEVGDDGVLTLQSKGSMRCAG